MSECPQVRGGDGALSSLNIPIRRCHQSHTKRCAKWTEYHRCWRYLTARADAAEAEAKRWRRIAERLECHLRDLAGNVGMTCGGAREEFLRDSADSLTPTSIPSIEEVGGIFAKQEEAK